MSQTSSAELAHAAVTFSISQKLGVVSVPLIGSLAMAFGFFGLAAGLVFQSALLETVISMGVILPVSLMVARVSSKSFLVSGASNLLLLGIAVFEFGFSSTLGGIISSSDVSKGITVYILGAFISSSLHLSGGVLTYVGSPVRKSRLHYRLWFSYIATAVFVCLLSIIVLYSSMLSAISEVGSISQRALIGAIIIMLLLSSYFFSRVYSRSRSPIVYWYSLALATTSFAFFAFFATQDKGDLATWTGIGGLCLASVYFLKSVLAAPKQITATGSQPKIR